VTYRWTSRFPGSTVKALTTQNRSGPRPSRELWTVLPWLRTVRVLLPNICLTAPGRSSRYGAYELWIPTVYVHVLSTQRSKTNIYVFTSTMATRNSVISQLRKSDRKTFIFPDIRVTSAFELAVVHPSRRFRSVTIPMSNRMKYIGIGSCVLLVWMVDDFSAADGTNHSPLETPQLK
jgi:hypothetical protein